MPDLINRYISNILTIDQIETITNKTIDGDFNTISDIDHTSLKKITNKAKLHDNIVYNDDPSTQELADHGDIDIQGLVNNQVLRYNSSTGKWENVTLSIPTDVGDIKNAANVGASGVGIFFQKSVDTLQFSKLKSNTSELTIALNSNMVEFTIASATNTGKGIVELADDAEVSGSKALAADDSRLTNARTPTAHATSHKSGGSDIIKLDELDAPTDVTTLNASTSAHGLMMKYPNNTTTFLRADGIFASPLVSGTPRIYDRSFSNVDVVSTTTKTTIYSVTIIGGDMGASGIFEVEVFFTYLNDSGSSKSLEIWLEFGGVIQYQCTIPTIGTDSTERPAILQIRIINKGVANSNDIWAFFSMADATNPTVGIGNIDNDAIQSNSPVSNTAASNINTASNQTLTVAVKHDTSASNIRVRKRAAYAKISQ